ncbi:hypothetical protein [Desulfosporosinus sp. BG]|uniref:hypothetical protein n=1 Tax=Desulfosporosinus sp. BG TaxID=1633135 RepID=UPI00083A5C85|nr:hypothetical protein [Desulfosporosinus sp. BG]
MGRYEPIKLELSPQEISVVEFINLTLTVRGMTKVQLATELQVNVHAIYNPLLKRQRLSEEMRIRIFKALKITNTDIIMMLEHMAKMTPQKRGN